MNNTETSETETFIYRPWWYMLRGAMMVGFGSLVSILAVIAPDMQMLGTSTSWLPVVSSLILFAGALRCIDAYTAHNKSLTLMNMQGSIIDLVCGFLILTSVGEEIQVFILIVAAYLLIQGLFRVMLTFVIEVPNPKSVRMGGGISVLMGVIAWLNWPFSDLWFLAFALSAEIAIRGWALMCYAHSVYIQRMA